MPGAYPEIHEYDINLLNVPDRALVPFVRGVSVPVFGKFLELLKSGLSGAGLRTPEMLEVEAVMNQAGEMIDFAVNQRSGSGSLPIDRYLRLACNDAFSAQNPPPAARGEDGNIHFIFRTAVEWQPTQRPGYLVVLSAGLL